MNKRLAYAVLIVLLLFASLACNYDSDSKQSSFSEVPELIEIKPEKPVRIKLKRNASGSYSWELQGEEADRMLDLNSKLRESLIRSDK